MAQPLTASESDIQKPAQAQTGLYSVDLDFFSGPLDLLLHLVNQQEVPVEKVSMKLVAEQYLQIISRAENANLDLNRLTEYLVIAATLVSIKSQSVLPDHDLDGAEETEEQRDPAFYEELRERLRQYELTKQRAGKLRKFSQLGVDTFQRLDRKAAEEFTQDDEKLAPQDGTSLATAFMDLLTRIGEGASSFKVRMESVSVVSYMMKIIDDLQLGGKAIAQAGSFKNLVKRYAGLRTGSKTRRDKGVSEIRGVVVGSFIAVLELCRRGVLAADQDGDSSDIQLKLQEGFCTDGETAGLSDKVVSIEDYMRSDSDAAETEEEHAASHRRKELNYG